MATFLMIFVVVCVLLLLIVTLSTVYVVRQQSVAIIEPYHRARSYYYSGCYSWNYLVFRLQMAR